MRHHRIALIVIAVAAVLDMLLGLAFAGADHLSVPDGLYFAVVTATTVGYGDILPHGWAAHVIAVVMMVTVVPLFGATFSLFTSGLVGLHVGRSEDRLKQHVEDLKHHLEARDRRS